MTISVYKSSCFGGNIFIVPVLTTIFIHGILGFILTANWNFFSREDWQIVSQPRVIEAHLVKIDNKNIPPPKKIEKIKRPTVAPIRPRPAEKVEQVSKQGATEAKEFVKENLKTSEASKEDFVDLMTLIAAEEQAFQAEKEKNISISHAVAIQRKVITYWSRPPSARNGMECVIAIQLVPTGEVVASSLLKSSGNKAFDLSALNAVKKAGNFPEIKNLSSSEFERNFRRFRLLFRPEDLRY